jgi:hypothetical protein
MAVLRANDVLVGSRVVTKIFSLALNGNAQATILSSYRVSSVTRVGTGLYTINLTTNNDANYCVMSWASVTSTAVNSGRVPGAQSNLVQSTTQFQVSTHNTGGGGRADAQELGIIALGSS